MPQDDKPSEVTLSEYLHEPAKVLAKARTVRVHVLDSDGSVCIVLHPGTIADLGAPHVAGFTEWWETRGMSSSCRQSAWEAWQECARRSTPSADLPRNTDGMRAAMACDYSACVGHDLTKARCDHCPIDAAGSSERGSFAPYATPEVMDPNTGRFSLLNGETVDTPATRLALELGRDIFKHANTAGIAPFAFAQKITAAINEALRLRAARCDAVSATLPSNFVARCRPAAKAYAAKARAALAACGTDLPELYRRVLEVDLSRALDLQTEIDQLLGEAEGRDA